MWSVVEFKIRLRVGLIFMKYYDQVVSQVEDVITAIACLESDQRAGIEKETLKVETNIVCFFRRCNINYLMTIALLKEIPIYFFFVFNSISRDYIEQSQISHAFCSCDILWELGL